MDSKKAERELENARTRGALAKRIRFGLTIPGDIKKLVGKALKESVPYSARRVVEEHPDGVGRLFKGMSDRSRLRLTKTLLPRLAPSVEAAWNALGNRPYQRGEYRKPFRCPQSDADLAEIRGNWLLKTALTLGEYDRDITWIATWAAQISDWESATEIGWLLAGGLDQGGPESDEVLEILKATASGDHEIGQMGRHVTQALMACSREDAWEFNEKLLLAAQRQEGLRQVILEAIDESHPAAFRRMLRLILEENLGRFSSVVRAFDTWFGFMWDGSSGLKVNEVLEKVLLYFDDPRERSAAIEGDEAEPAYLALWTLAFEDVESAIPAAALLLDSPSVEKRFVATHLLAQTNWGPARSELAKMLRDDDLRVAARALLCLQGDVSKWVTSTALFGDLEELLKRLNKRTTKLDSLVWPWWSIKLERSAVAEAMSNNNKGVPAARMLPYVKDLGTYQREWYIRRLAGLSDRWSGRAEKKPKPLTGHTYDTVVDLLGDPSPDVRGAAFEAIGGTALKPQETDRIVGLLNRKAGDLRNRCIERLRALPDSKMLAVADRLLAEKDKMRRIAGLELLRDAVEADRSPSKARELAQGYREAHASPEDSELTHLDAILGDTCAGVADRNDALGLIDPTKLRSWDDPKNRSSNLHTDASSRCIDSLARLILENHDFEVESDYGDSALLTDAGQRIWGPTNPESAVERESKLPLREEWVAWNAGRSEELRDPDGLELVRAWIAPQDGPGWKGRHAKKVAKAGKWSSGVHILRNLLEWCIYWEPPEGASALILDGLESTLAEFGERDFRDMEANRNRQVRVWGEKEKPYETRVQEASRWLGHIRKLRRLFPAGNHAQDGPRLYSLLRWFQIRSSGYGELQIQLQEFVDAYAGGAFGDTGVEEFIDLLVGELSDQRGLRLIDNVSGNKPAAELENHVELLEAVERCRRRIVEVESQRGDRTTAASSAAMSLRWSGGLEAVSLAMQALGSTKFARTYSYWDAELSRKDTLSNLVVRSTPRDEDSTEAFAQWARQSKMREARLVELAAYAPQWVSHVNHVLEWPGLENAVWWVHAHTKDDRWRLRDLQELWTAQVSERTPLSAQDLTEGAVDVEWFHATYADIGVERWNKLYKAAKYASSSGGHKRAQLFASAMTGEVTREDLLQRIEDKRHQDSVRALGLIPLANGKGRQKDLLERYRRLQEFKRESRKYGSQRQASEGRAMTIGMENLARTAGFRDPLRLQWAMEMETVKDLARGPVTVEKGETAIQLSIDEDGKPELSILKNDRKLKSVPAKLRKDPDVVELRERLKELRRQASRVKAVLEEAMCRGDAFDGSELQALFQHPILAPSLSRLIFVGDDIIGYPVEGGKAMADHRTKLEPVRKQEQLRIAHPNDLLERGDWPSWQNECFRTERVQPFKQVFRELYPITDTEKSDKLRSRRYAGHQVNPRQALSLLGSRGWVAQPEEGVSKTYHQEGLTARLGFEEAFYTPADIEGLTLELVAFTKKGKWDPLDLATIPPRVFSETMRDLDLVVSVAHQGGVDPEATASTLELRASLLKESCSLLGLENVEVKESNVVVRGKLSEYSVHLGSATASILGGPSLVIVAVPSQHRGRLFLPFADDDPRTAEVLSKVLLLARDHEMKDPNILDQIRRSQA